MIVRPCSTWRFRSASFSLAVLLALGAIGPADARALPPTCAAADHAYTLVQRDALKAAADYATCLSQVFGRDDCASRFAAVTSAQSRFVVAIADIRARCGQ